MNEERYWNPETSPFSATHEWVREADDTEPSGADAVAQLVRELRAERARRAQEKNEKEAKGDGA